MSGGKIIGEGEDGCVFSEPMWPCKSNTDQIIDIDSSSYVSKLVKKEDNESEYIKVATRILGPQLSAVHLVTLKGECSPSTESENKAALLAWDSKQACGKLKKELKQKHDITSDHKIMYMARYPMTLSQWGSSINLRYVEAAIPPFLSILQKLYQNPSEQLINLDLHAGNIFVRPLARSIQFGLADFGHCLFRQHMVGSGVLFYGKYLCDYIDAYELYHDYIQIPFEARFLNFIYKKHLDTLSPGDCIKAWLRDPNVIKHQSDILDASMIDHSRTMDELLSKPLFIAMIEILQSISRKLSQYKTPTQVTQSLSTNEKTVLEFIITRYGCISPINIIASICLMNTKPSKALLEFVRNTIRAPYDQVGSSITSAVRSVQGADLGIVWTDVLSGFDS